MKVESLEILARAGNPVTVESLASLEKVGGLGSPEKALEEDIVRILERDQTPTGAEERGAAKVVVAGEAAMIVPTTLNELMSVN